MNYAHFVAIIINASNVNKLSLSIYYFLNSSTKAALA